MNHVYRSIWNQSTQTTVAVPELARRRGGKSASAKDRRPLGSGASTGALRTVCVAAMLAVGTAVWANPLGGTVTAGSARIGGSASQMVVTQTSQNAAIDWQSFSIAAGQSVSFVQPDASAVALNRVLGSEPSSLFGQLNANGQVFLINPSGILFAPGASVNVQGLVASTLGLSDASFMAGQYHFAGTSAAGLVNQGAINANGGYVALLGANVSNQGTIQARLGSVALAAGQAVTLDLAGDALLGVQVDQGAYQALVDNGGVIQADGGTVLMTTQAAGALLNTVVRNTGIVQAQTVQNQGGVIRLLGDMSSGTVDLGGTLDASAPQGGNGGSVETSAAHVALAPDARVTTWAPQGQSGTWLIDPTDYTIGTGGDMTGAQVSTALTDNGDLTIYSSQGATAGTGNIYVEGAVTWATTSTLSLYASNNILIGYGTTAGSVTATGNGSIKLTAADSVIVGSTGAQGIVSAQGTGGVTISTATGFTDSDSQAVAAVSGGSLVITQAPTLTGGIASGPFMGQVDLASTASFTLNGTAYVVIDSLGSGPTDTTAGTLQSLSASANLGGHYVLGQDIDASGTASGWSGGFTPIGTYLDNNANSSTPLPPSLDQSKTFTGVFEGLGHAITQLTIASTAAEGTGLFGVTGGQSFANIGNAPTSTVGVVQDVALIDPTVSGVAAVGALVGFNSGIVNNSVVNLSGTISGAGVTGANSGSNYSVAVGGLVGTNLYQVTNSVAHVTVGSSNTYTNSGAQIAGEVGGLVGYSAGSITDSQASGAVTAYQYAGGLVGNNLGTVTDSSASGHVTATGGTPGDLVGQAGGLAGVNAGTITGTTVAGTPTAFSFATGNVSGNTDVGGLVGLNEGNVALSYASGTVSGTTAVGGLVGGNVGGAGGTGQVGTSTQPGSVGTNGINAAITTSYASGTVSGSSAVGGLVGLNTGGAGGTGAAGVGGAETGGVGGSGGSASISQSYADGSVTGASDVGGLVGRNSSGAAGANGASYSATNPGVGTGGAGGIGGTASITDTYASASVSGSSSNVGGLVGNNTDPSGSSAAVVSVATSYSNSTVGGSGSAQGLAVGSDNGGTYTDVYYLTSGSRAGVGSGSPSGISSLSSLSSSSSFTGFSFSSSTSGGTWGMGTSPAQPFLCAVTVGCTVNLYVEVVVPNSGTGAAYLTTAQTSTYGNSVPSFEDLLVTSNGTAVTLPAGVSVNYGSSPNAATPVGGGTAAAPALGTAAGSYNVGFVGTGVSPSNGITFSGASAAESTLLDSYVLSAYSSPMSWTVNKAALTVTTPTVTTRTYNGSTAATLSTTSTLVAGVGNTLTGTGVYGSDDVTLSQVATGTFASKNAGSNIPVTYNDTLTGAAAGNYQLVLPQVTGDITQAPLTVTGQTVVTKTYDGTVMATLTGGTLAPSTGNTIGTTSGVLSADHGGVTLTAATSGTYGSAAAGTESVTVVDTLSGSASGNYTLVQPTLSGLINKAPLTLDGLSVSTKTYDGTADATLTGTASLVAASGNLISGGIYAGDAGNVSLSTQPTTGTFASINASTSAQAVTVNGLGTLLTGSAASNYTLVSPPTLTGFINPAPLDVEGTLVSSRAYDGTATATLTDGTLVPGTNNNIATSTGVLSTDATNVTLVQAGTFASVNAGASAQAVTATDRLTGSAAGNYVLVQPTGLSATISAAQLTVSGVTVSNKTYDGTNQATLSGGVLIPGANNTLSGTGVFSGDASLVTLTVPSSGSFAGANVVLNGSGVAQSQSVSAAITLSLSGSAATNYTFVQPTLSATIYQAPLTLSGLTAANKTYDGTTAATLNGTPTLVAGAGNTVGGVYSGDAGAVSLVTPISANFASVNASTTPQTVTVDATLTGSQSTNYTLVSPPLTATISPAPLLVAPGTTTVAGKTYDGTTTALLSGGQLAAGPNNTLGGDGIYSGDATAAALSLVQSGHFQSANASATAQSVTATDTLTGTAAGNYVLLTQPTGLSAVVSPAELTVTGSTVATRTYNGGTAATVSGGTLAPVSGSNAIGGDGVLAADAANLVLTPATTGQFASPNAGTQAVSVVDTLSGSAMGNYLLVQPVLSGTITAAPLTASGTTVTSKTYDGTAVAALSGGSLAPGAGNTIGGNGVVAGDAGLVSFTAATTGSFASPNASSTAQAVAVVDTVVLSGSAANNYVFVQPTVSGLITPAPLTISGQSVTARTYNGGTGAALSGGTLVAATGNTIGTASGVTAADAGAGAVQLVLASTGSFAGANASSTPQAVSYTDSLSGAGAANYVLIQPALSGLINPAPLTVTGTTVAARTYNGTTVATLTGGALAPAAGNTLGGDGVLNADASGVALQLSSTGQFASPNASTVAQSVAANDSLILSGSAVGNYTLVQPSLSGVISQAPITVVNTASASKTYNGSTLVSLTGGTFAPVSTGNPATSNTIGGSGVVAGDLSQLQLQQQGFFANANASTSAQAVTAADSLSGAAAGNYVLVQPTGLSGQISPAPVTVSGTVVAAHTYDGTVAALVSGGALAPASGNTIGGTGVLSADASDVHLTTATTGVFASPAAGTESVQVVDGLSLSGSAVGNYVLVQPAVTGTISPAPVVVVNTVAAGKTYDGTTAAALSGGQLAPAADSPISTSTGLLASDANAVTLVQSGQFASANASPSPQAVQATDTLTGAAAGNYVVVQPTGLTATISPAPLTVTGSTAANRTYNGTAAATVLGGSLAAGAGNTIGGDGVVSADAAHLSLVQSGSFASVNASSTAQAVSVTDALSGSAASNYVLTEPTGLTAMIAPAPVTVIGSTVTTRTYNGSTAATVTGGQLAPASGNTLGGDGVLASDAANVALQLTGSGSFASPNASSTPQAVSVQDALTLSGSALGNYVLVQPTGLSGVINPAPLTVIGTQVQGKVFDGSTTATLSSGALVPVVTANPATTNTIATASGVLAGDASALSLVQTGNFASDNAGSVAQAVTAHDSLGGAAASNYVLIQPTGLTGSISPATLTLSATTSTKTYDGTTLATAQPTVSGLVPGTTLSGVSESYASANVLGTGGSTLVVNGGYLINDGNNGGNYTVLTQTASGTINPATLTVLNTLVGNKVYDGTTATTVQGGVPSGLLGGDSVTLTQSGQFTRPDVGTAVPVQVSDTISGSAASNYTLVQPTGLTGSISAATLTVTGTVAANKVFDGTTAAQLSGGQLQGLVSTDVGLVGLDQSGHFLTTVPASSLPVVATDSLSGTAAGNYVLVEPTGLMANITPNLQMPTAARLSVPLTVASALLSPDAQIAYGATGGAGAAGASAGGSSGAATGTGSGTTTTATPPVGGAGLSTGAAASAGAGPASIPALAGLPLSVLNGGINLSSGTHQVNQ